MKKRIHFLAFLGIFIFIIIPKNVYAEEVLPYQAIVNQTFFIAESRSNGSIYSQTISANGGTKDFTIQITTVMDPTTHIGTTFVTHPYVYLFFETYNTKEQFTYARNASCNNSCFNGNNMVLKQIGVNPDNDRKRYVLILPVLHTEVGSGESGDGEHAVQDVIRFTNTAGRDRVFTITNILISNTADISEVVSYEDIINNATANTTLIIQSLSQAQAQTSQKLDDLNDTMKDESAPSNSDVSSKASEWASLNASDTPISVMLLMPITLLNAYSNGLNGTCSPYNLGNLYGTDLILPCINISNYIGATLWNVIDVLFSGLMIYAMGKKFVRIFNDFTNLRDNQVDELYGGGK